jgi:hypothetical protein
LNNIGAEMKIIKYLVIALTSILINGCAVLQEPIIKKHETIDKYQYVVIPATSNLSSSTGGVFGGQYGVYGASTSKEVNPGAVIEGILLKKGLTSVNEIRPEIMDKTLIVKYGESGRRDVAGGLGGYTLEVTIIFISAKTYNTIYSCTAEGQGSTEADDIREAITRCLSGL